MKNIFYSILLFIILTFATSTHAGNLIISCDYDGKLIYLDERKIGITPISDTLIVKSGQHFISFFNTNNENPKIPIAHSKRIEEIVKMGTYPFWSEENDTTKINLLWQPIQSKYELYTQQRQFAYITEASFAFVAVLMFIILTAI